MINTKNLKTSNTTLFESGMNFYNSKTTKSNFEGETEMNGVNIEESNFEGETEMNGIDIDPIPIIKNENKIEKPVKSLKVPLLDIEV